MGRLCAGLGEAQIPQLMPWLLDALCRADAQAVERASQRLMLGGDMPAARTAQRAHSAWQALGA